MAVQDDIRKKRDEFSAGKPIQATQVAPTRVQAGTVNATQVAPGRVLPSAPIMGGAPRGAGFGSQPPAAAASTAQQAGSTLNRALSPGLSAVSSLVAPGMQAMSQAGRPGMSAQQRGADVRNQLSGVVSQGQDIGRAIVGTAKAVGAPVLAFGRGLVTGQGGPAPVTVSGTASGRAGVSASANTTAPNGNKRVTTPTAAVPTGATQSTADALRNPAPNTYVGTNTGVRTLNADGGVTPSNRPGQNGQVGSFNVVPASAISNPGIGTLGANFAGASQAPNLYRQQVEQAQARNQATRDRIESGGAPTLAAEGTFRPGTGAGLNKADRQTLDGLRAERAAQGSAQVAERGLAEGQNEARMAEAQLGEAGADRRLAQQGQQRMGEIAAQRNVPQLQFDAAGNPFVFDAGARTLSPVAGAEGFRGASQSAIDPGTALKLQAQELSALAQSGLMSSDERNAAAAEIKARYAALMEGGGAQQQGGQQARTVVRTGTVNGRRVAEYSDGTIEEVN